MKKILLNISLALALGFSISSCNDWLDGVEQTSTVSDEIVWQDEAYVDKYVNAFYTYLNKYGQFGESQFSGSLTGKFDRDIQILVHYLRRQSRTSEQLRN